MDNNTQAVATQQPKPLDALKKTVNAASVQEQFKNALGNHKDAFVASLIDLYIGDKQLQQCNPALVVSEALRAAVMRLPLSKQLGFSYIVVFNNNVKNPDGTYTKVPTPTFIPGYKGYIQLAMRTGQYRNINADVVYEGEVRKVNKLTGEIDFDGEKQSDNVIGYFCHFELLNGFSKTLYMTVEEMAKYAKKYSPTVKFSKTITVDYLVGLANKESASGQVGWIGNFNDMALKTVIRRLLSRYGYLSVEMQDAISKDVEQESTAFADRNDTITEEANAEVIDVDEAPAEEAAPANKQAEPVQTEIEGPGY